MNQNTRFFAHLNALWALFIIGSAVINLPFKNGNEFTFLAFILAAVLGVVLYLIILPIAKTLFITEYGSGIKTGYKILLAVSYSAVAVFALICGADTFRVFVAFIKNFVLKNTPIFFISVIFLAVIIYFSTRRQEDILKFFMVAFVFVIMAVTFFFIANSFKFNLRYIFVFELPNVKELITQAKPYVLSVVIPSILMPFYMACVLKKVKFSHAVCGYALGVAILGICVVSSCLIFGTNLAGRLDYPYSSAISTVSIGRLYTRLDGFSYFIYFASSLAKIVVCVFVIRNCAEKIKNISN